MKLNNRAEKVKGRNGGVSKSTGTRKGDEGRRNSLSVVAPVAPNNRVEDVKYALKVFAWSMAPYHLPYPEREANRK